MIRDLFCGAGGVSVSADSNFKSTSLLLNGDGTNGAQNNTFLDSSANNITIIRSGNTTQGSLSPFSPNGWSCGFNGSNDKISIPTGAAALGSGNWTIECWWNSYGASQGNYPAIIEKSTASNTAGDFSLRPTLAGSNVLNFSYANGTTYTDVTSTGACNVGGWHHLAICLNGTSLKLYMDGLQVGSATMSGINVGSGAQAPFIASSNRNGHFVNGCISNLRLVAGTAVYTAPFTPPISPLTAISGTILLCLQDNRFKDNSTNNYALTITNTPKIINTSPFPPTAEYSPALHGGSMHFDGTGDYLNDEPTSTLLDIPTSNFTIEAFVYPTAYGATYAAIGGQGGGSAALSNWVLNVYNTGAVLFEFYYGAVTVTLNGGTTTNVKLHTWTHVAAERNGNVFSLYVNGVSVATSTNAVNVNSNSMVTQIGSQNSTQPWFGYISNFRIVYGTAIYAANFTPPAAPLTAITNTRILLSGINSNATDKSNKNVLETVGNAQISTTQKKYGSGSLYFDGTGDYLSARANSMMTLGPSDWTIECWLYLNSVTGTQGIIDYRIAASGVYPLLYLSGAVLYFNTSNTNVITGSSLSISTWYHIAVVKSSGSTKLYINGTQAGSTYTDANNYLANTSVLFGNTWDNNYLSAYIDDLRITKGIARYTATFTPPAVALPTF